MDSSPHFIESGKSSSVTRWVRDPVWTHTAERDTLISTLPQTIFLEDLEIESRIGSSSQNGRVYVAVHRPTSIKVALKLFPSLQSSNEIGITEKLGAIARDDPDAPYLICFGSGVVPDAIKDKVDYKECAYYVILELAAADISQLSNEAMENNGSLRQWASLKMPLYFSSVGQLTFGQWQQEIAFQAFCCLEHMHRLGYLHRDVHLGNFMVLGSGKLVIIDFGTAQPFSNLLNAPQHARQENAQFRRRWTAYVEGSGSFGISEFKRRMDARKAGAARNEIKIAKENYASLSRDKPQVSLKKPPVSKTATINFL